MRATNLIALIMLGLILLGTVICVYYEVTNQIDKSVYQSIGYSAGYQQCVNDVQQQLQMQQQGAGVQGNMGSS
jgi:hypothetical protein